MRNDTHQLARLREESAALKLILLPDDIWDSFKERCVHGAPSFHHSILLGALECGCLDGITEPIERFLIENGSVRADVTPHYRKVLRESWVLAPTAEKRKHEADIFRGFLTELQLAAWLDRQDAEITGLAAGGAAYDLVFRDSLHRECSVEVKYMGMENAIFEAILAQLSGEGPRTVWRGMYDSADYLTVRVFEAAKQLEGAGGRRVACLALSADALDVFKGARQLGLADWRHPELARRDQTDGMRSLLGSLEQKHSDLDNEIAARIRAMTEIWVVSVGRDFEFSWVERVRPATPD
ncbi:MAG: hypothetical protein ABIE42_08490 [Candidatus Eisenbacteria bacterium]